MTGSFVVCWATAMPAPSVVEPLSLALTTSAGPLPTTSPPDMVSVPARISMPV